MRVDGPHLPWYLPQVHDAHACRFDVIGDIHGQLDALTALLGDLGYDRERSWAHPEGRVLVFLGDLVDRGPKSLEVVQLVAGLCARGQAHCLMGNHEFNLLESWVEGRRPRRSNTDTLADVEARSAAWAEQLPFLAGLPLAIEIPAARLETDADTRHDTQADRVAARGLRLVHACWHLESVARCREVLAPDPAARAGDTQPEHQADNQARTWAWLAQHITLSSPFTPTGRKPNLPEWGRDGSHATCAEVLNKGLEEYADPQAGAVVDPDGAEWKLKRVMWWLDAGRYADEVATDLPVVFGHFWHVPPRAPGDPTAPSRLITAPDEKPARVADAAERPGRGRMPLGDDDRFLCVDFNGMLHAGRPACVGAYRWPEHELVWSGAVGDAPLAL